MSNMNKFKWTTFAASACAAAFLTGPVAHAQALTTAGGAQIADSVVAVVNNDVITERELNDRSNLIVRRLQQQNAPVPPAAQLQRQVLDQMVLERIQLQKAKEDNITIDAPTVQRTLERLAQQNQMTIHRVPGAFELPLAAKWLADTGRFNAVQGGTRQRQSPGPRAQGQDQIVV